MSFGSLLLSLWNGIRRALNPVIGPKSALESEARHGGFCELRPPWSTLRVLGQLGLSLSIYPSVHTYTHTCIKRERETKALIDELCMLHQGRNWSRTRSRCSEGSSQGLKATLPLGSWPFLAVLLWMSYLITLCLLICSSAKTERIADLIKCLQCLIG